MLFHVPTQPAARSKTFRSCGVINDNAFHIRNQRIAWRARGTLISNLRGLERPASLPFCSASTLASTCSSRDHRDPRIYRATRSSYSRCLCMCAGRFDTVNAGLYGSELCARSPFSALETGIPETDAFSNVMPHQFRITNVQYTWHESTQPGCYTLAITGLLTFVVILSTTRPSEPRCGRSDADGPRPVSTGRRVRPRVCRRYVLSD